MSKTTVYTIGHSTHRLEHFIAILRSFDITAIADVRSIPYSRHNPQFNRETLRAELEESGIAYVFLGRQLGARPDDPGCYENGKVQYDRLASTAAFQEGLSRVRSGAESFRIALMCAERDPLQCHRTILVSRYLIQQGTKVIHILAERESELHHAAMKRLMGDLATPGHDLFRSAEELEQDAYRIQGQRIAYQTPAADKERK